MSSTARAPEPQAEPQAEAPTSADPRVIVVTGATLPATVAGSIAARHPATLVVPIAEFTASSTTSSTTVIFAAEDLAEAWQLAKSTDPVAEIRLAFRTASATGLSAVTGYALDTVQPSGEALIVTFRPDDHDSAQAGPWLSRLAGALPAEASPASADSPSPTPRPRAARPPATKASARSSMVGLLRRHRSAVAIAAIAAVLVGVVAGFAFDSLWLGVFLGGFAMVALVQLALAFLSFRAASAARTQAETAARTVTGLQQRLVDQVQQITASSAETTLLMREYLRDNAGPRSQV